MWNVDMYLPVRDNKKIPELVFHQIKESILSGKIGPGDKLPTERELVEQFKASRIAIREGLKSLEAAGLIVIRSGAGIFVNEIGPKQLSESLSTILRYRKVSFEELTEARTVFEPAVARLAAERITPENVRKLEDKIHESSELLLPDSVDASVRRIKLNAEFHSIIAESTQNLIISLTMKTFFDVLEEMTLGLTYDLKKRYSISRFAAKDHRRILRALRDRNPELAHKSMLEHIIRVQESSPGATGKKTRKSSNVRSGRNGSKN